MASAVAAVVEEEGRLDGFVHNATSGLSPRPVRLADVSTADLLDHIAVSVRGSFLAARAAYPHLVASQGALLLLTSEAGIEGKSRLAPYAAVKAAQRGMVRALAREWGRAGVRVNAIAPLASSPAMERAFEADPAMEPRVLGRNPLGRLGDPVADIGAVARYLLSEDSAYVTGHTIPADGGSCALT
jgi:3-oxoacyl-[acyl-carrier protein] reductase